MAKWDAPTPGVGRGWHLTPGVGGGGVLGLEKDTECGPNARELGLLRANIAKMEGLPIGSCQTCLYKDFT